MTVPIQTVGVSWWVQELASVAGLKIPQPIRTPGENLRWRKPEAEAFVASLRDKIDGTDSGPIVTAKWWATALATTTTAIANMVRKGRRGRGWDRRIIPPLDLPGHARWRRADAVAHVQSFKSEVG